MSFFHLYAILILPYPQLGKELFQHHLTTALNEIDGVEHEYLPYSQETRGRSRFLREGDTLIQIRGSKRLQEKYPADCLAQLDIIMGDPKKDRDGNGLFIAHNSGPGDVTIIIHHIYKYFKQSRHYLERSSYLRMMQEDQYHADQSNPVTHYLLDLFVCKEICTYIPECIWDNNALYQSFGDPFEDVDNLPVI